MLAVVSNASYTFHLWTGCYNDRQFGYTDGEGNTFCYGRGSVYVTTYPNVNSNDSVEATGSSGTQYDTYLYATSVEAGYASQYYFGHCNEEAGGGAAWAGAHQCEYATTQCYSQAAGIFAEYYPYSLLYCSINVPLSTSYSTNVNVP